MNDTASDTPRTLFDISRELLELADRLDALGGDVSDPDVEAAVDAWFERLGAERDEKLDHYAAFIRELEARAEARKEEARRLMDRARQDADRAAYLKERLVHFFNTHHLKTVETRRYRLTVATSGGKAPVVLKVDDPERLPEAYQRIKVSADLNAIRDALERGDALDFAELGPRSQYVRIS